MVGQLAAAFSPPKYAYCIYDAKFNQLTMFSQSAFQVQSGMTWNGALGTPKTPPPRTSKAPFRTPISPRLRTTSEVEKQTSEVQKKTSEVLRTKTSDVI